MGKIIIVGGGEVGAFLCECLSDEDFEVILIEQDEDIAELLDERLEAKVIRANGCSAKVLADVGTNSADFFIALTSDDRTNLISCSLAKAIGCKTTICRIHDNTYSDSSYVNYQIHFGIDILINPEALSAVELAKIIRNPGRVAVENFARGQIEVQQMRVFKGARITGKPLKQLKLGENVRIGFIQRNDQTFVATAESIIEENDLITLFGKPEAIQNLRSQLDPGQNLSPVSVVLFGGSETAISLVRLLTHPRFNIRIIEKNERTCERIAETFPHVTVIHGDGTSLRLLEEEQIGKSDYYIACTKDDQYNIMACLLARKLGTKHVQLVVNKTDYDDVLQTLIETIGLEKTVSPRIATVNEVLRYTSTEPFREVAQLPDPSIQLLEFYLPYNTPLSGQKIRDISFPQGTLIVALMHKFKSKVPTADDVLLGGDRMIVITYKDKLNALCGMIQG